MTDLELTESPLTLRISDRTWAALPPLGSRRFFQKLSNIGLPSLRGHVSLVSLEAEMIKVSDTQAQFQAAANIYAKAMSLMRTAIGH